MSGRHALRRVYSQMSRKAVSVNRLCAYSFRPAPSASPHTTVTASLISKQNYATGSSAIHSSSNEVPVLSDAQRRTIYALSTPPGKAGVAVIRVSGPDALEVWRRMVVKPSGQSSKEPKPWKMERCRIVDPITGETLDDGLAAYFAGELASKNLRLQLLANVDS
jgi:tRNA modification GTPase